MLIRRLLVAATALVALATTAPEARAQEAMRIAYLSPSFDISDAWERVFWALQGRLDELGVEDESLLELAMELERIALEDDYFAERKLFPNVDFYSGIILKAIGFPTSMFTVLFAVARTVGWVAQWKEMIEDPSQRIGRPRQLYVGEDTRPFVPIAKRT